MSKPLVVVSFFDGMSCGQLALKKLGITNYIYYAAEIDKYAIKVTQTNFPNTIQIGDVSKVSYNDGVLYTEDSEFDIGTVDLFIGGSPCQGFSFAGSQLNFDDPRSMLFFEFVRFKNEANPENFLLENVVMKKPYQDVISEYLGVHPELINSSLVSPQNRKRLYWSNLEISQPEDKNVSLSDIIEFGVNPIGARMVGRRLGPDGKRKDYDKNIQIKQRIEVRVDNKTNCMTTVSKDCLCYFEENDGNYKELGGKFYREFTRNESEMLQTVQKNYTGPVSVSQAKKMLGNGWTVNVIAHILSCMNLVS